MKAFLMHEHRDFDAEHEPPPGHQDLIQDLGLETLFGAIAAGDEFLLGVARKAGLSSLSNVAETESCSLHRGVYCEPTFKTSRRSATCASRVGDPPN
jgi:hypothetical protein